ncbi:MAG: hypothetical protein WBF87_10090 [Mesorhizobium sp.]
MIQKDNRRLGRTIHSLIRGDHDGGPDNAPDNASDHGQEHGWHHAEVRSFLRRMSLFKPEKDVPRRFDELLERLDVAEARTRRR